MGYLIINDSFKIDVNSFNMRYKITSNKIQFKYSIESRINSYIKLKKNKTKNQVSRNIFNNL